MSGARPSLSAAVEVGATTRRKSAEIVVDGRYRVVGKLGSGAMGVVHRADDIMLERPAALKMIEPAMASSPAAVERFFAEARALARLRHDNVVQIYAFGKHESSYFFAMELVDGDNLAELLEICAKSRVLLPTERTVEIVGKIAAGLTAAHARSLVHRDVKPTNIMIERETGRPVLVDFGVVLSSGRASHGGGTPSYMAPEQIRNDAERITHKVDVYALACTAFEMLTGRLVFLADSSRDVMTKHLTEAPPLVSSLRPDLGALDPVFARALAKEPRWRHASCVDFAVELANAVRTVRPARTHASSTRVLVLAEGDGLRRIVDREAIRALDEADRAAALEHVASADELRAAFARRPAELVVVDEERGGSAELVRELRAMAGGGAARVLVLTREMLGDRAAWEALNVRRMAKPLNARWLGAVFAELSVKVVESEIQQ